MTNAARGADDAATGNAHVRTVLVPLDGSSDAQAAIPVAREVAEILGATVRLLHVSERPMDADALLDALALIPESLMGAVIESASGSPDEAILNAAAEHDAAVTVMCTTGWTGAGHRRVGHVAEAVLRKTTRPLLLVTPEVERTFAANHRRLQRMLLPLDGSPITAAALGPAVQIACACNAQLDVVHVVGPNIPTNRHPGALSVPRYQDQPHLIVQHWTREFLRRFCGDFPSQPQHILVEVGDPGEAIVRVARDLNSDVIIIAWKGAVGRDRARTARAVLRGAPCPVLFLRTADDVQDQGAVSGQPDPDQPGGPSK